MGKGTNSEEEKNGSPIRGTITMKRMSSWRRESKRTRRTTRWRKRLNRMKTEEDKGRAGMRRRSRGRRERKRSTSRRQSRRRGRGRGGRGIV